MTEHTDLIERLRAREKIHRDHIHNSQVVIALLAPQMALFERERASTTSTP